MAVTGVLAADFASFFDAVKQAEVSLKSMESGGAKVEGQLNRMTESFSGRRVITEATLMAEVFERAGGASAFTQKELARMSATGEEAAAKMRALGQDVPEGIDRLAKASERATPSVGGLKGELMKFDGLLASVGINASGPIRAIGEIGDMAGKSVTEVGLLGSVGAAFGAGVAGWKVGRLVADFFDLDTKIGNATAKLLGWGDVAGETAAAKAEELNGQLSYQANLLRQAEQATEDHTVVLSQAANEWNFAASAAEEAAYEYTVYGDVVNGIIQSTGEAIAADEAYRSGLVFTTEVIAEQADSLDMLAEKKKADAVASREAAKAAEEAMKVFKQSFTSDIQPLSEGRLQAIRGGAQDDGKIWQKLKDLETAESSSDRGLFKGVVTADQYRAANEMTILLSQLRQWADGQQRPPGFASGVENFSGGLAYVHKDEMLVNLPAGTDVIPAGRGGMGGSATENHYHFNLAGMVGDKAGLARMIESAFREMQMNQGSRLVARA